MDATTLSILIGGIITTLGTTALAVWKGIVSYKTELRAKEAEQKAKDEETKKQRAEQAAKTLGIKHDGSKIFRRFMLIVEQELNGFDPNEPDACLKLSHDQKKLDRTLNLMLNWSKEHNKPFDYAYWVSQYNEEKFFIEEYRKNYIK